MRILIVEDDFASRRVIQNLLSDYGHCDLTVDGVEAVEAFILALNEGKPYGLVCLDIMMPKVDGIKALKAIRELERQRGIDAENAVKIIIVSALNETEVVHDSFDAGSEAYAVKPINTVKFIEVLGKLGINKIS